MNQNYLQPFRDAIAAAAYDHSHGNLTASGKVGTAAGQILVTLAGGTVTATQAISTTQITDFAAAAGAVKTVNGMTGTVVVSQSKIASVLGNDSLETDMTSVDARFPSGYVAPGVGIVASSEGPGGAFRLKGSTGFVHSLAGCTGTVTLMAGANVTISANQELNRVTISAAGGSGGVSVVKLWPAIILGG
jgi:hypothetical protein